MNPFRWGILGCGKIARKFAEAVAFCPGMELCAVASRDAARARAFAATCGEGVRAFGDYRELLESGEIDAVYLATVNSDHFRSLKLAVSCGVPVLCEKPMLMTLSEFDEVTRLARERGVALMEAMWSVFLPSYAELRRIKESGELGKIRYGNISFCVPFERDPSSRIYNPALGGGLIYDIGVYVLHALFHLFGTQYSACQVTGALGETGTDIASDLLISYPDGTFFSLVTADVEGPRTLELYGERGSVRCDNFSCSQSVTVRAGEAERVVKTPFLCNGFEYEIEEFAKVVQSGKTESDRLPLSRTRAVLAVMEEAVRTLHER